MTSMVATSPQMMSMYAQPQTYAAAPTMTSMYATPGTTTMAAAPMVETIVAPQAVVQAPTMMVTQTPSYMPAPQQVVQAPAAVAIAQPGFAMPMPVKLTEGLVEPGKLEAEKGAYHQALAAQLKKQTDALMQEASIKKAMVDQQAKTQLAQFQLQVEEQLKMSCLGIDQEAQQMCAALQEAAITQQTMRDEQTAVQAADYMKKKAMEEMSVKSYETQKQWFEQEVKMVAQYEQVRKSGSKSVVTPNMVV